MSILAKAEVFLGANTTGLVAGMAAAEKTMEAAGARIAAVGRTLSLAVTLPLAGIAAASIKTATEFDTSMRRMGALVGIQEDQLQAWRGEIRKVAPEFGVSATTAADALYFITSAGLRGTQAMETLTASMKGTAIGLGETKVVADAATSAMNAYAATGLSANRATEILAAGVKEGKFEASELAPVLGSITGLGSALKVSFDALVGTLAALSRTGTDAASGATELQAIMSALLGKSPQAEKALKGVGLTFADLRKVIAEGPSGLVNVMRLLDKAFQGNVDQMALVIPNIRAFRGIMNILAQDGKTVDTVINNVHNSIGFLDEGMGRIQGPGLRMAQAWAKIKESLIAAGDALLPVVVPALEKLAKVIVTVAEAFEKATPFVKGLTIALIATAAAAGPVATGLGTIVKFAGMIGTSGLVGAFSSIKSLLLGITAGGIVALGLGLIAAKWLEMRAAVDQVNQSMKEAHDRLFAFLGSRTPEQASNQLAQVNKDLVTARVLLRQQEDELDKLKKKNVDVADPQLWFAANQAHKREVQTLEDEIANTKETIRHHEEVAGALNAVVDAAANVATVTSDSTGRTHVATEAEEARVKALTELGNALASAAQMHQLLGDRFDYAKARAEALSHAIATLVDNGAANLPVTSKQRQKLDELVAEYNRLSTQIDEAQKLQQLLTSAIGATIGPIEKYQADLAFLQQQMAKGNVTQAEFARAQEGLRMGLTEGQKAAADAAPELQALGIDVNMFANAIDTANHQMAEAWAALEKGKEVSDQLKQALLDMAGRAIDAIVDFAFTGKASFGDFVRSALADIAKLILKMELLKFVSKALGIEVPGHQFGGFIKPGELGIVGEAGPELIAGGRTGISVKPLSGATAGSPVAGVAGDTVHMTFQIQAVDSQGVAQFVQNSEGLITNAVLRSFQRSRLLRNRMGGG